MEASKKTISDILNGSRILEVPFFQRSYVWDADQWERFLSDMENISYRRTPYFLGAVILKQLDTSTGANTGDIRSIIDGQQRLTTIQIFLKALSIKSQDTEVKAIFDRVCRLMWDKDSIAFKHNHNDKTNFERVINLDKDDGIITGIDSQIIRGFNYFYQNIDVQKIDLRTVLSMVMFVVIDLAKDENEQQIFDTINSLGVRLTTAELLKNELFDRDELQSYIDNWKSIFETDTETKQFWDREITAGRNRRSNIDLFFYSFLQIKLQDKNLNISSEDKKNLGKVDGLFDSYKTFISKYQINKTELIQEVKEYARLYQENVKHDIIETCLSPEYGIDRINAIIFGLDISTMIPYILYVLRNVSSSQERQEIFKYLESYTMRRIVCHATSKNYNRLFSEELIQNEVKTVFTLKEIIETKSDKTNYIPSDQDVTEGFLNSKLTNKQTRGVLYMIESAIRNNEFQSTTLLGLEQYTLEHIMPKKWENHWNSISTDEERSSRNKKLLTLGNLTIITSKLNTSIRDASWEVKKNGPWL